MDNAIDQILGAAGFAGALLVVLGWAYWRKDMSEKAAQVALVKQAEKHGLAMKALQSEFIVHLQDLQEKRTGDAQRVSSELLTLSRQQTAAVREVAVTNTEIRTSMGEVRRVLRLCHHPEEQD